MLQNVLAVLVGCVVGGVVNMGLIAIGPLLIPPPAGVDMTTVAGMEAGVALLEPRHFLFPWLAHALGTLVGAALAARLAAGHRMAVALDLVAAYLPMAWVGGTLARRRETSEPVRAAG